MNDDRAPVTCRIESGQIDDAAIIALDGELDLASAPQLVDAVNGVATAGPGPVILDLGSVSFVDSSGVRAILESERLATDQGRPFAIYRPGDAVTRLLDLVDLRSRFTELDAIDSATIARLRVSS